MKDYVHSSFDELDAALKDSNELPEGFRRKLVETAGFIPLEVRLKQLEQQGYVARFSKSDFTSDDMRLIWLDPENEILPGDDIEEVQRKQLARQAIMSDIMSKKVDTSEAKMSEEEADAAQATE